MSVPSKTILIVTPSWVGDMVMAQSLLKVIKQTYYPAAVYLDVFAPAWSEALFKRMPEVRHIIPHTLAHGQWVWQLRQTLGQTLYQQYNYQQAIVLPHSWKSALVPFWAKIPKRTGYLGEWRYGLLNDIRRLNRLVLRKTVERFVALGLSPLDYPIHIPQPILSPGRVDYVLQRLQLTPSHQPILALCPGAEYGPAKRWPLEYFAIVAKHQLAQGWQVWLLGSEKEASIGARIHALTGERCVNLCGQTTLAEVVDLLSLARAVVTNDSGLMHVAAALNKPLIVLYGSSSPAMTPPLNPQATILSLSLKCSPCFKRVCPRGHLNCLRQLKPHQVIAQLEIL